MPYRAGSYDERTPLMHENPHRRRRFMKLGNCGVFAESMGIFLRVRDELDVLHYNDEAGRGGVSLAGLHAAQALIFERNGKVIKRHRGVHVQ